MRPFLHWPIGQWTFRKISGSLWTIPMGKPISSGKTPITMKPTRNPFIAAIACGAGAVLLLGTSNVLAADFFWDADPGTAQNQNGNGIWNTTNTNWNAHPVTAPANISWENGSANTAFLGNAGGSGYSNPSIGGTITLGETIDLFALSMSGGQTGSYVINGAEGFTLNMIGSGEVAPYVANNNGSATLTINAAVSGSDGLRKINSGRVILNGENTYTGRTSVNAGTLQFTRPASLYGGDAGEWTEENITVAPGATLALNVGGAGEFTSGDIDDLTALGGGGGGFAAGASIGFDTTNASGGVFTHSSAISNPDDGANTLGLTKLGTNTLILSGENTYSGVTLLLGGTIGIGNGSALGTGQLTANNVVGIFAADEARTIPNNFFLSSVGSSVLTVSGSHSLTLDGNISASGSRTVTTTIASGGLLTINGDVYLSESNTQTRNFTFGSSSASGSPGTVLVNGGLHNNAGANTLASNLVVSGGGTVILAGANTYTGTTTVSNSGTVLRIGNGGETGNLGAGNVTVTTGAIEFNRSDSLTVGNNIGGTGIVRQVGEGTTILTGTNSYGGVTTILGGVLQIANASALGTTAGATTVQSGGGGRLALSGGISVGENITINARNTGDHLQNVAGDNALTGTLTWGSGGTAYGVRSDEGKLTLSGPVSPLLGSKTLNVHGEGDVEFTGPLNNTATGILSIVKNGGGTLTFSSANTYTGTTTVNEGTLVLTSNTAIDDAATLVIAEDAVLHLPNAGTEIVGALIITGLDTDPLPDGLYHSGNTDGFITGPGQIQVGESTGTPFENWIATNYPEIPEEDRDPSDDPDFDGTPNILEFAIKGDPTGGSDNGLISSLIEDSRLKLVIAVRDGADFDGGGTATVDGITYTVEGSLVLDFPNSSVSSTDPFDTAPAATGLPDLTDTDWEYHVFTLDASEGLPGKGFLRLKVTEP